METEFSEGSFILARGDSVVPIAVDADDYAGVVRAAHDLKDDIFRVTDKLPTMILQTARPRFRRRYRRNRR